MATTLDQTLEVETPEQVVLTYTVAGVGSRAAAAIIDTMIILTAWLLLGALLSWAAREFGSTASSLRSPWLTTMGILGQFVLQWGYFVLFEALADGQTPGKRRMRLRVVRDGGYAVTFGASAVRNLVRVVDQQPAVLYFVGMLGVILSRSGKRLGDFAAGTIVVQERALRLTAKVGDSEEAGQKGEEGEPLFPRLPDDLVALLERFAARAPELELQRRSELADTLIARVSGHLPDERLVGENDLWRVLARERRARSTGPASSVDAAPGREERAIVAAGMARWQAFAARLQAVQARGGLSAMPEEDVAAFVAEYRDVSADLARMQTAARGRAPDELYYLSRLVAAGHNLLYRRRELPLHEVLRFLLRTAPAEVRRSWRPVALAALLLFGPMALAFSRIQVSDESGWNALVGASLRQRVEEALERPLEGRAYLPEREARARGPVLASAITTNNVQVAYVAFAGGMLAGVPTVASMIFNGLHIGAAIGYYHKSGIVRQILGFVAAHGVLELFAICLGGGAGLLLAAAILMPGSRTRSAALVDNGKRAIILVGAATAILVVAGIIEGTISPNLWPDAAKYSVSALTAVALVAWLARGRTDVRMS
jgi:uncharacterized membrane protein SpoIIM required for sporulation/uncharacterized RDD family membrane protein YckC